MPDTPSPAEVAQLLYRAQHMLANRFQLIRSDTSSWLVLFKDGGAFRIEWSEAWERLVLTGVLCTPGARNERAALNLALSYNRLWRETGHLRMAREAASGALTLIGEWDPVFDADADAGALGAALLHFEGLRRRWGVALAGDADAETSEPEHFPGAPFERV